MKTARKVQKNICHFIRFSEFENDIYNYSAKIADLSAILGFAKSLGYAKESSQVGVKSGNRRCLL